MINKLLILVFVIWASTACPDGGGVGQLMAANQEMSPNPEHPDAMDTSDAGEELDGNTAE